MLVFRLPLQPCAARENAGCPAVARVRPAIFETTCGGFKSPAPDIRCLAFAAAPGRLETGATEGGRSPAVWLANPPAFPDSRRRPPKSSSGYPVLAFYLPAAVFRNGKGVGGVLAGALEDCRCFPTRGGGSKSQAPDIRCLTLGSLRSAPISHRNLPGTLEDFCKRVLAARFPAAVLVAAVFGSKRCQGKRIQRGRPNGHPFW